MQIFTKGMVQVGSKGVRKLQHTIQSKTSPKPHFPTMSSSLLKSLSCPCSKIRQLITVSRSRKRRKALKKSTVKDQASSGKESTGHCRNCTLNFWSRKIPWRRKRQPFPVFLQGEPVDRGTWQAAAHGLTKSRTRLSNGITTTVKDQQFVCVTLILLMVLVYTLDRNNHMLWLLITNN